MSIFVWFLTWDSGEEIEDHFDTGEEIQDVFELSSSVDDIITPYYLPDAQLISPLGRGTIATQVVGGLKPSNYWIQINNANVHIDTDAYGDTWSYEMPLWFGHNPFRVLFYDPDGYGVSYTYVKDIFLERVYVPIQPNITVADGYDYIEGTYYQDEGYGAIPDAYGSTKVLFSCGQTQFPSELRIKFLTNRGLSSGVIVNGVEREGYLGYKKYFGSSPLFDGHSESKVEFDDGYGHYYTIRTDGYGDGYGAFRDPLRRYGTSENVIIEDEQIQILPDSKYDVYDEAENQTFVVVQGKNERLLLREGETLVQLQNKPDNLEEVQIYREYDFVERIPAAQPVSFDDVRKVLTITPLDADGYGIVWTRIAYTTAGAETTTSDGYGVNNFRETPDGYGVNEDLLEKNSLQFDFKTSLKRKTIGLERNYETEILDDVTDHKMCLYFFKKNEFGVEMQLNPGFDIRHIERFARTGNELNLDYVDNGKREIIVHIDYRGLNLGLEDGDGYGHTI